MRVVIAALLALLLTGSATAADVTTVYSGEFWTVNVVSGDHGKPYCYLGMSLTRYNRFAVYFAMVPYTDGTVSFAEFSEDWEVKDGRHYGSAIISIDNSHWRAPAYGYGDNAVTMTLTGADDFWPRFIAGHLLRITYPQDRLEIPLRGSSIAFNQMMNCYETLNGTRRFNPFGTADTFNPFGN